MYSLDSATESAQEGEQLHSRKDKEKQPGLKAKNRARSKSPAPPGMKGKLVTIFMMLDNTMNLNTTQQM